MIAAAGSRNHVLRSFAPVAASLARGHCQVPCGIFTDDHRVKAMQEDAQTIRKAIVQAQELHKNTSLQDLQQIIRWVQTKEDHASKIMETSGTYFMAQKIKKAELSTEDYHNMLSLHHAVMVAAMKTKQSADLAPVDDLDAALKAIEPIYCK